METKFYYLFLKVYKGNDLFAEYQFSDLSKQEVFNTAVNAFRGYILALADFSHISLCCPSVCSLDGYNAWNDNIQVVVVNSNDTVICSVEEVL